MRSKKNIKIPIYECFLEINIFDKTEDVPNEFKEHNDRCGFVVYNENYLKVFIHSECQYVIPHKAIHIKNGIFKHVGMKLDVYNDEAEAYLVEWICIEITNLYIKHKKNNYNNNENRTAN